MVTYKGYAKELWDALSEFHDRLIPLQADDNSGPKESLPYFGGMNGSNRYNEADCVICAGLGRFDSEEYFNRALAFDFGGSAWGEIRAGVSRSEFPEYRTIWRALQNNDGARSGSACIPQYAAQSWR